MAHDYSGRILFRLPKSLHKEATQAAKNDGVSLNMFILTAVAKQVGASHIEEALEEGDICKNKSGTLVVFSALNQYGGIIVHPPGEPHSKSSWIEHPRDLTLVSKSLSGNV